MKLIEVSLLIANVRIQPGNYEVTIKRVPAQLQGDTT